MLLDYIENRFRVRDVGSSNGTFVNNARVSIFDLGNGDIIRAGMTVLSVSIRHDDENPHDKDGLLFNHSPQSQSIGVSSPNSVDRSPDSVDRSPENGNRRTVVGLDKLNDETTVKIYLKPSDEASSATQLIVPAINQREKKFWWANYFTASATPGMFEQSIEFISEYGNLAGLVLEFGKEIQVSAIINLSQLEPEGIAILQRLLATGNIETISWSLCLARVEDRRALVQLVDQCLGRDAIIFIGSRVGLALADAKAHANSLSYPSLFCKYVLDPESVLRKELLKHEFVVLFELDAEGRIGLLTMG